MERSTVQEWLDGYIRAWERNDAEEIAGHFAEDAVYSYGPFSEEIVGRDAIARSWLQDPDEPGSWSAEYRPVLVEGGTAIANGRSRYLKPDGTLRDEYDNIFLIRLDAGGRCSEFREWFMERPKTG
jgi:ketosteroid isomerase-like protein